MQKDACNSVQITLNLMCFRRQWVDTVHSSYKDLIFASDNIVSYLNYAATLNRDKSLPKILPKGRAVICEM